MLVEQHPCALEIYRLISRSNSSSRPTNGISPRAAAVAFEPPSYSAGLDSRQKLGRPIDSLERLRSPMLDREQPVTPRAFASSSRRSCYRGGTPFPTGQLQLMDAHKSIRFVAACGKTPSVVVSDRQ